MREHSPRVTQAPKIYVAFTQLLGTMQGTFFAFMVGGCRVINLISEYVREYAGYADYACVYISQDL